MTANRKDMDFHPNEAPAAQDAWLAERTRRAPTPQQLLIAAMRDHRFEDGSNSHTPRLLLAGAVCVYLGALITVLAAFRLPL